MRDADIKTLADSFVEDLTTLRSYASRALSQSTPLTVPEEADKSEAMERFWDQGSSLNLTHRDLVRLLFQGMFPRGKHCGCATCLARREASKTDQPSLDL